MICSDLQSLLPVLITIMQVLACTCMCLVGLSICTRKGIRWLLLCTRRHKWIVSTYFLDCTIMQFTYMWVLLYKFPVVVISVAFVFSFPGTYCLVHHSVDRPPVSLLYRWLSSLFILWIASSPPTPTTVSLIHYISGLQPPTLEWEILTVIFFNFIFWKQMIVL